MAVGTRADGSGRLALLAPPAHRLSMDLVLVWSGFLMGLVGTPHCAAMCGPACTALLGGAGPDRPQDRPLRGCVRALDRVLGAVGWFHAMRLAGYAAGGALLAAGVGLLAWAGQAAPLLRPVWTLLHVAALALGLWLLVTAQQPNWMVRPGRPRAGLGAPPPVNSALAPRPVRWVRAPGPWQAGAAGGMWVAWPCGLLQSALVVAGLASTPAGGAAVMAAFALSSSMGLQVAPTLWRWWQARSGGRAMELQRWVVRLSGGMLALGSAWALGHGAWSQIRAYCLG